VAYKRETGQAERIPHRPGRKPKFTPPIRERLRSWLKSQPDLTLKELQKKLEQEERLHSSQFSIWTTLGKMGLRLKKVGLRQRARLAADPAAAPGVPAENKPDRRLAMGVCG
jgi:transposase